MARISVFSRPITVSDDVHCRPISHAASIDAVPVRRAAGLQPERVFRFSHAASVFLVVVSKPLGYLWPPNRSVTAGVNFVAQFRRTLPPVQVSFVAAAAPFSGGSAGRGLSQSARYAALYPNQHGR